MSPTTVYLPNGQTLTVTPVFGGLAFRANELNTHHNVFPPGWTINLHSQDWDEIDEHLPASSAAHTLRSPDLSAEIAQPKRHHSHRFREPTLRGDQLFISSISNPSSNDFRPPSSPTRQIAMMLWATLYWYFHQQPPSPQVCTTASKSSPVDGRPKGDWRVNITREGIFTSKHLLPKLERMGLISCEDSTVGLDPDDGVKAARESWTEMFVSQKTFWQLDPRIYLFSLSPTQVSSPYPSLSPAVSRPSSPTRNSARGDDHLTGPALVGSHFSRTSTPPPGPFYSGSHLPTFYPPPPPQYVTTNGARHPIRPKPPRQGETFYTRYIPSLGQYLSFRVACLSKTPVGHRGPVSSPDAAHLQHAREILRMSQMTASDTHSFNLSGMTLHEKDTTTMSDVQLLHKWMNDARVAASWGEDGPMQHQEDFLKAGLTSKHSFPVIGCFDGRPFGYFEIYWVKEDRLATQLDGGCNDWDRGLHVLVGENEFRGPHRVKVWLSALVHYCLLNDMRTNTIMMEPRVDNVKLRMYCEQVGFFKEKEVTFPHKQSNLMKIRREAFECPEL